MSVDPISRVTNASLSHVTPFYAFQISTHLMTNNIQRL